jgi:hypothetical protein
MTLKAKELLVEIQDILPANLEPKTHQDVPVLQELLHI